jgi:hypothetical protein
MQYKNVCRWKILKISKRKSANHYVFTYVSTYVKVNLLKITLLITLKYGLRKNLLRLEN